MLNPMQKPCSSMGFCVGAALPATSCAQLRPPAQCYQLHCWSPDHLLHASVQSGCPAGGWLRLRAIATTGALTLTLQPSHTHTPAAII